MDPKESRRYTTSNPPIEATERRPSLLGRLFRRSSSTTDDAAIQAVGNRSRQNSVSFDETPAKPPTSITAAVKEQFVNKPQTNPEFNIFT